MTMPPPPPNTQLPLLRQIGAPKTQDLGRLARLIGNWSCPSGRGAMGYSVMPLPTDDHALGYINKNHPYFEEMTFTAPGIAANRGGTWAQQCAVITYEQRVFFANSPSNNTLVHFENGLWLNVGTFTHQTKGAYAGSGNVPSTGPAPTSENPIVKQVSVPHGNSILATGKATPFSGKPECKGTNGVLPRYQHERL